MAKRYHTNDSGKTLPCTADVKACRFVHGTTPEESAANWQEKMTESLIPDSHRSNAALSTEDLLKSRYEGTFFGEKGQALKMSIALDSATAQAVKALEEAGFQPLIVGGAVRDALLGRNPKDFDIEVHGAKSFEELRKALAPLGKLNLTGKSFGVLKLQIRQDDGKLSEEIDLALPRRDSKVGNGHRGFTVEVDAEMGLLEATSRRDLTVNALFWDPSSQQTVDLHGGFADMEAKRLRHVSDAFSEDPLRVLRVARFASKLGFDTDPKTVELSRDLLSTFDELPEERISGEMAKMILEPSADRGLAFLRDSGWGEKMGIPQEATERSARALSRGLEIGKALGETSARRSLQIAVLAENLPKENRAKASGYFAMSKAEAQRGLQISEAGPVSDLSDSAARQWAWDNQKITARERIYLDYAKGMDLAETHSSLNRLESLGILDGHEPDRFDAQAVIESHRKKNPGLRDGPWIREILQKERDAQYAR